jgi:hypothetical protein
MLQNISSSRAQQLPGLFNIIEPFREILKTGSAVEIQSDQNKTLHFHLNVNDRM